MIDVLNVKLYVYIVISYCASPLRAPLHELSLIRGGWPAHLAWRTPLSPACGVPRFPSDLLLRMLFCRKRVMGWSVVLALPLSVVRINSWWSPVDLAVGGRRAATLV